MIKIEKRKQLIMSNVLSFRKEMTQQQMQEEMIKIGQIIQKVGAKKEGSIVTATFALELEDGEQVMDTEILVPLDKEVELPSEYKFKKEFKLFNAVYARYVGNPIGLQNTLNEMIEYIEEKQLQRITTAYNVQVNDIKNQEDLENMIIDTYIGVSMNKL